MNKLPLIIIMVFILIVNLNAYDSYNKDLQYRTELWNELHKLTQEQRDVLFKAFESGAVHDLPVELVLPAIAWKETNFGEKRVNKTDGKGVGSYGVFQILLSTAVSRVGKHNVHNISKFIKKLTNDDNLNTQLALKELSAWYVYHNGDMIKVLAGYNGGTKGHIYKQSMNYARDVMIRMDVLKNFILNQYDFYAASKY